MKKVLLFITMFLCLFMLSSCNKTNSKFDELYQALEKTENNIISKDYNSTYGTKSISVELEGDRIKIRGSYYDITTYNNFIIVVYWEEDASSMAVLDYNEEVWWSQTDHNLCMDYYIDAGEVYLTPHGPANERITGLGSLFLDDVNELLKEKLKISLR